MIDKYLLSCLITMHEEGSEVVKPLLDSIAIQQNIDFNNIEVVITHDGLIPEGASYRLTDTFLQSYPFSIKYLQMEHGGVSAARNHCLDNCSGEYVMFMDCDDMFFHACGLWMIFNELKTYPFDMLVSKFVEETRTSDTGEPCFINRENDSTFVHGKVLRRQFLIKNNIRWNEKLTIHEDSYLNCLCKALAVKSAEGYKYYETPFYLWKWRKDSVCRKDPLYLNKTFTNMLDSNSALVNEFISRELEPEAISCVLNMVYETYYNISSKRWSSEEGHSYLLPMEKRFKKYWLDFKYLFDKAADATKLEALKNARNKYFNQGMMYEKCTFTDWIKHIEEIED